MGLIFLVSGVLSIRKRFPLLIRGQRSQGVVVGHNTTTPNLHRDGRPPTTWYFERVKFFDVHGKTIEVVSEAGSSRPSFAVGEKVKIIYPKADPKQAMVCTFRRFWLPPILFICMGLVLICAGFRY
jgi:hypothetical protein